MSNTKKALWFTLLSMVLCIAMLLGTTYAWFTDTATSNGNKILAGTLDIDLLMDKAGNGNYTEISDVPSAIFGATSLYAQNNSADTVWEPGKTQIVYLAVKNNGNLAIKYNILLTVTDGGLVGALEYAIIDGAKAENLTSATKWSDITSISGVQTGDVTAGTITAAQNGVMDEIANGTTGETQYFALAVHMKETADNTYQNKNITIDVLVKAGQATAEKDVFSEDYDKSAEYGNTSKLITFKLLSCETSSGIDVVASSIVLEGATWADVIANNSENTVTLSVDGDSADCYLSTDVTYDEEKKENVTFLALKVKANNITVAALYAEDLPNAELSAEKVAKPTDAPCATVYFELAC